jgi:hypothetical protein
MVRKKENAAERRAWVLDHETKGTGAHMVPLDKVADADREGGQSVVVVQPRKRRPKQPEPRAPRRFKVVDVMTRQTLAEDVGIRDAVQLLEGIRSSVDVTLYARADDGRWQQLTHPERQAIWQLRGRLGQE